MKDRKIASPLIYAMLAYTIFGCTNDAADTEAPVARQGAALQQDEPHATTETLSPADKSNGTERDAQRRG